MFGEDRDIEFGRLIEALKKNILLIIVLFVIGCSVGYAYTKIFVKYTYSATATIIVVQKNKSANQTQYSETDTNVSLSDLQISRTLVNTYKQVMFSNPIAGKVVSNLSLDKKYGMSMNSLKGIVNVTSADNTEVMNITATTGSPTLSADIANEMVKVFQKEIYNILSVENVTILNHAQVPSSANSTNMLRNVAIGGMGGIFISLIIILIKVISDRKVKTVDEVRKIFDYPIIGEIPDFNPYVDDNVVKEETLKNEQN